MSRGPVHAGDVIRAAGALGVEDAADVLALRRAMGLPEPRAWRDDPGTAADRRRPRPLPEPDPEPGPPPSGPEPSRQGPGSGPSPAHRATPPPRGTVSPADRPRSSGGSLLTFPAPVGPDEASAAGGEPPSLESVLFHRPDDPPEQRPAPPWNPRTERAILLAVAATEAAGREVDRRRLVQLAVRGPGWNRPVGGRVIPYRPRATTRAGLQLLLDRGPAMRPFRHDHQWIVQLAHRVLPPDQLRVLDVRPAQAVGADGGRAWLAKARLAPGAPLLLVSDLGHLRLPVALRHQVSTADWLAFVTRLRRAGHPVACLTPFPPEAYPPAVRRAVALVPLDRRTSVSSARDSVRQLRRPGRLG